MKNKLYAVFILFTLYFSTLSCMELASLKEETQKSRQKEYSRKAYGISADEHLTERVWVLAACYFEGSLQVLDANMTESRLKFSADDTFKAANGISSYNGTWKKGLKKDVFHHFSFYITERKTEDPSNTVGKPFDEAFLHNFMKTKFAEIDRTELKFYSKDKILLLRFIRL